MAVFCHLRAMFSDPGYVPLPHTKIDFSSDLEKTDTKKIRKVSTYLVPTTDLVMEGIRD
jgi:hypothetical protein